MSAAGDNGTSLFADRPLNGGVVAASDFDLLLGALAEAGPVAEQPSTIRTGAVRTLPKAFRRLDDDVDDWPSVAAPSAPLAPSRASSTAAPLSDVCLSVAQYIFDSAFTW